MHRHEGRDWDSPEACPICKLEKILQCKEELYQLLDAISETDAEYVSLILDRLENEGSA